MLCANYGKMKKNQRGQIKMQQMAFMIVAVFIFFVLVGLFVLGFSFSGLKRTSESIKEKNSLLLVTKLANSPEFTCGESFGNKVNCIDADKVLVLKNKINKYYGFWEVSNIIIRKITESEIECKIGNYDNCGYIDVFSKGVQGFPVENFVTLCKKDSIEGEIYNNCEISKLIVYYKSE